MRRLSPIFVNFKALRTHGEKYSAYMEKGSGFVWGT